MTLLCKWPWTGYTLVDGLVIVSAYSMHEFYAMGSVIYYIYVRIANCIATCPSPIVATYILKPIIFT